MTGRPDARGQLREQTGLYVLGALAPSARIRFEAHLAVCTGCAAEVRTLGLSIAALGRSVSPIDPRRGILHT